MGWSMYFKLFNIGVVQPVYLQRGLRRVIINDKIDINHDLKYTGNSTKHCFICTVFISSNTACEKRSSSAQSEINVVKQCICLWWIYIYIYIIMYTESNDCTSSYTEKLIFWDKLWASPWRPVSIRRWVTYVLYILNCDINESQSFNQTL